MRSFNEEYTRSREDMNLVRDNGHKFGSAQVFPKTSAHSTSPGANVWVLVSTFTVGDLHAEVEELTVDATSARGQD